MVLRLSCFVIQWVYQLCCLVSYFLETDWSEEGTMWISQHNSHKRLAKYLGFVISHIQILLMHVIHCTHEVNHQSLSHKRVTQVIQYMNNDMAVVVSWWRWIGNLVYSLLLSTGLHIIPLWTGLPHTFPCAVLVYTITNCGFCGQSHNLLDYIDVLDCIYVVDEKYRICGSSGCGFDPRQAPHQKWDFLCGKSFFV